MKQKVLALILLASAGVFGQPTNSRSRAVSLDSTEKLSFERQLKIAVLVGIGQYPSGSGLNPLKYAARDAEDLGSVLQSQGYAVKLLTEAAATKGAILDSITAAGRVLDREQGTLIFAFSGHGTEVAKGIFLAAYESGRESITETGLSLSRVEQLLLETGASRKILLIDACRSGPGGSRGTNRTFSELQAARGLRTLYATGSGEESWESDEFGHGVFTHYILRALQGGLAPDDGLITFSDLASYVGDEVRAWSFTRSRRQTPFAAGEYFRDFLIAKTQAAPSRNGSEGDRGCEAWDLVKVSSTPMAYEQLIREFPASNCASLARVKLATLRPINVPAPPHTDVAEGTLFDKNSQSIGRINSKDGLRYLWIPPGEFRRGCSVGDDSCQPNEKPAFSMRLDVGFWIGQTEVTQSAYRNITGTQPSFFEGGQRPVENVTWQEAKAYCEQVGMRLPTEIEWEHAARGWTQAAHYADLTKIGWFDQNSRAKTNEVGQKLSNVFGTQDMLGNVWEWVADPSTTNDNAKTHPATLMGSAKQRVARGGSWITKAQDVRVSTRLVVQADAHSSRIGFRCAGPSIP